MKYFLLCLIAILTTNAAMAGGYPLKVEAVKDENGVWEIIATNAGSAPVFLSVALTNKVNVRIGNMSNNGQVKSLEPGARETLLLALSEKEQEKMSFDYEVKWVFGRGTNSRVEHNGLYRPPFPADLTFDTLSDIEDNRRSPRTINAIDILMDEGTPVIAARKGHVMDFAGSPNDTLDGSAPFYEDVSKLGNYVRIIHDDGTWAEYGNLKAGSVTVKQGQRIEAGTQIGKSGPVAKGRPYLQFVVLKPTGGLTEPTSVPIRMDMAGRGILLVKAGDAMGASQSVVSDAVTTINDPLVIASVTPGSSNNKTGVYSSSVVNTAKANGANVGDIWLGLGIGVFGALAIFLIMERKRYDSWKIVFSPKARKLANKTDKLIEEANGGNDDINLTNEFSILPSPGFFVSDWETGFIESISLAMPVGYSTHYKVALNRLLDTNSLNNISLIELVLLREASLDVVIVRSSDKKVAAVLEAKRTFELTLDQKTVLTRKMELLKAVGIPCMQLNKDVGPSEIRDALKLHAKSNISFHAPLPLRKTA